MFKIKRERERERERETNSLITDACVCCGIQSMNDSTEKA